MSLTEKTDIRDSDEKVVEIEMERLGYKKIPVIIRMMQDDEAVVTMVDSNLQRGQSFSCHLLGLALIRMCFTPSSSE